MLVVQALRAIMPALERRRPSPPQELGRFDLDQDSGDGRTLRKPRSRKGTATAACVGHRAAIWIAAANAQYAGYHAAIAIERLVGPLQDALGG
jgi:hypothetical protein